jgi:hypothetical protein
VPFAPGSRPGRAVGDRNRASVTPKPKAFCRELKMDRNVSRMRLLAIGKLPFSQKNCWVSNIPNLNKKTSGDLTLRGALSDVQHYALKYSHIDNGPENAKRDPNVVGTKNDLNAPLLLTTNDSHPGNDAVKRPSGGMQASNSIEIEGHQRQISYASVLSEIHRKSENNLLPPVTMSEDLVKVRKI